MARGVLIISLHRRRIWILDLLIRQDCAAAGVPESSMELEMTEGILVGNFEKSAALLQRLKIVGGPSLLRFWHRLFFDGSI